MYGNITSHLYVFKRGPFITEIPRQLFKGQRTLRPGITHHLARSVASEDTSVPLRGGPGGSGLARPGPSQGRGGQERAPGREPGPGVGSAPWPPSICPACLGAKWGARGPLPSLQQPVLECGQQGVNNRSPTGTREPPAGLREGRPAPGHWGHGSGTTPGRQTLPPQPQGFPHPLSCPRSTWGQEAGTLLAPLAVSHNNDLSTEVMAGSTPHHNESPGTVAWTQAGWSDVGGMRATLKAPPSLSQGARHSRGPRAGGQRERVDRGPGTLAPSPSETLLGAQTRGVLTAKGAARPAHRGLPAQTPPAWAPLASWVQGAGLERTPTRPPLSAGSLPGARGQPPLQG